METQRLTKLRESFYYTNGDRLWNIYYTQLNIGLSRRFPNYTEAQRKQYTKDHLVRNEDELAKTLFPSDFEGMDYRGRGPIHLTHKETYSSYKNFSGNDVISNPKLLEEDPAMAVDSACWFWSKFAKINSLADADNLSDLTYKVNTARLDMVNRGEIKNLAFNYIKKNNTGCIK
ncbi:glycoside hydrolase family 19 protein [Trabulsiella odontotermitis]|uniref:glycoside hydrolase family 19 protein n=1 Tax=Trabulsiella odontotermitis TaxID=379893 RepID=UPI0006BA11D7|nr:glycoside hydrolase family 19 protein [Trabulsiella odontotermitis]